jgi:hypothetical protein
MTFQRSTPNAHYRSLRLVSSEGQWELGFSPYQYGCRLRMGPVGRPPMVLDLCLGRNPGLWCKVLTAVLERLDGLHESCTPKEIDAMFPWSGTRPDLHKHWPELVT